MSHVNISHKVKLPCGDFYPRYIIQPSHPLVSRGSERLFNSIKNTYINVRGVRSANSAEGERKGGGRCCPYYNVRLVNSSNESFC